MQAPVAPVPSAGCARPPYHISANLGQRDKPRRGLIITTNHKTDGIYLPADDRRHFVAWSDRTKEDERFEGDYWNKIWTYYSEGGLQHVAAYLRQRDISGFNPKAPPPKTAAFWTIADANRAPEESELADFLESLGYPKAVPWINDRKNRRTIPHRLEKCGYTPVRNSGAEDGLWKISGRRQAVYAKIARPNRSGERAIRSVWSLKSVISHYQSHDLLRIVTGNPRKGHTRERVEI